MRESRATLNARRALQAVLCAGFLFLLATSLPGHLSSDSVVQLYEGRFGVRESFGPAVYAKILGLFDGVVPGTGLYVTASALILFWALLSLAALRGRVSWLAVGFALLAVASPTLMLFQGVVWKDILFANLTVAGFVALASAAKAWTGERRPWALLTLSAFWQPMRQQVVSLLGSEIGGRLPPTRQIVVAEDSESLTMVAFISRRRSACSLA